VFPGQDGRRYRIVSFVAEEPRRVLAYVLDEEREDTVGDKYWQKTTTWTSSADEKLVDVLMAAIVHLMNPPALIANDAELEGKRADAATIMAQPTDKRGDATESKPTPTLQVTCRRCDLQFAHAGSPGHVTCPGCGHAQVPNFTAEAAQCTWPRCRRPSGHVGNHVDQQGEPIMCSSSCGRGAGHGGKCHEAHP
jgi:hypothetical protein